MIKSEINEIKKLYNIRKCSIRRMAGCYVNGEKEKKTLINQSFLTLPEDDIHKYLALFKKALSGSIGKNLLHLDFPLEQEEAGGTQEFLLRLRNSELQDDALLEEFYDKIIASYDYVGNYLILLAYDVYDVPSITNDKMKLDDASEESFAYLLVCICPVNLTKAGLGYFPEENLFQNRTRDWIVDMPDTGFLFPAFDDRSSNIHSTWFYKKDAEDYKPEYIEQLFSCPLPLSAKTQKETFHSIIEETLGESCDMETVLELHEKLEEIKEAHKEDAEPLVLEKKDIKNLLQDCEVPEETIEQFDSHYEEIAGESTPLLMSNVANNKSLEIKTPDVIIKVKPEAAGMLKEKTIDGKKYLTIALSGEVEVNGITLYHPGNEIL